MLYEWKDYTWELNIARDGNCFILKPCLNCWRQGCTVSTP